MIRNYKLRLSLSKLTVLLLCLVCFSYPIVILVPVILGLETTVLSIIFRFFFLVVSFVLIVTVLKKGLEINQRIGSLSLIFLFVLYFYRFFFDIIINDIVFNEDLIYTLGFAFSTCIFPFIAVTMGSSRISMNKISQGLFWFIYVGAVSVFIIILKTVDRNIFLLFTYRLSIEGLNPITISAFGGLLFILCLLKSIENGKVTIVFFIGIIIGLILLTLGASRGPALITALLVLYLTYYFLYKNKFRPKHIFYLLFFYAFVIIVSSQLYFSYFSDDGLAIFSRFESFFNSSKIGDIDSNRNTLWLTAMNQFYESPILGSHYLEMKTNYYPHNIVVEILMSTGLVGIILFAISIISNFSILFQTIRNEDYSLVGICFIFLFISQLSSGGLFLNGQFWLISTLMLNGKYE